MKRIKIHSLISLLLILMLLCSTAVHADSPQRVDKSISKFRDSFVPSITSKGAPEIDVALDKDGDDITDLLVITPYGSRDELKPEEKKELERSYIAVDMPKIVTQINEKISSGDLPLPKSWEQAGEDLTLDEDHLTVTDLFYVHEKYDTGTVKLDATVTIDCTIPVNQLVVMMYYDGSKWVYAPCRRTKDGKLSFVVKAFGPYMIITNTVVEQSGNGIDIPNSPQTGEDEKTGNGIDVPNSPRSGADGKEVKP